MLGVTAFQTVGPYFDVLLRSRTQCRQVTDATLGIRVVIDGVLYDGAGRPVPDGLVEIWQADAQGRYGHPDEPHGQPSDPAFYGYGWSHTGDDGAFRFETVKPGAVLAPDGRVQAPHILVSVMARGVLTRYVTRLYFGDEAANESDPILALVPADRRLTLLAQPVGAFAYRFDIRLQGADETVFFDV